MNAMDLKTKGWIPEVMNWAAPHLESKLGQVSPSHKVAGPISTLQVYKANS
jgi:hypothetical protein